MPDTSAGNAGEDQLWRMRWMMLASLVFVFAALGILVSEHHKQWRWSLFLWGLAVGVAGLAIIAGLIIFAMRRDSTSQDLRVKMRRRLIIYTFGWVGSGLVCGTIAGSFDQPWVDIGVAIYVVVTLGAGTLFALRRRNAARAAS